MKEILYKKKDLLNDFKLLIYSFSFDHFSSLYVVNNYNDAIKNQSFIVNSKGLDQFEIKGEEFDTVLSDESLKRDVRRRCKNEFKRIT